MTYGIQTQSRASRVMNAASNAIAGAFIPYVGDGAVQTFRSTLDKFDGLIGTTRFSIYKDTDVPSLDGLGTGIDVGEKIAGTLKGIAKNVTSFIGAYGVVN